MLGKNGFTLIELLVVMAIIGILAATAIVNFGRNDDRDVRQEKDRLTSFLREVQNKSLTIEKISGVTGKVCGFGVRQLGSTNNLESFYVSTADLNADCVASWKTFAKTSYETLSSRNGASFVLTGNVFFLSPNAVVDCDGCALPISINVAKGDSNINATIDETGRIY